MQPSRIVPAQGTKTIALLANESIAVYSQGKCQVIQNIGYPNLPSQPATVGSVNNGETVFGPYASGASITLNAGAYPVAYETGLDPVVIAQRAAQTQKTPGVLNATGALTAAMLLAGIVTSTTAAAVAGTVPTGTVLDTELDTMQIDQSIDFVVIATGANAFTVTAAAGVTIVGNAVVATVKSGEFRLRKTAVATYVIYRKDGG